MQYGSYIKLSNDLRDQLLSQDLGCREVTLRGYAAADALQVRNDVEETKPSEVRFQLRYDSRSPDGKSKSSVNIVCKLDDEAYFGDYSDNSALCDLIAACEYESPGQTLQSVSWTINSIEERDPLSRPFLDFVAGAVRSNGYRCNSDIELGVQPTSASIHGFDAFNLRVTLRVNAQLGDASNG